MSLTDEETKYFLTCLDELNQNERFQSMKNYIQHGDVSTYDHVLSVAYYSFLLSQRLPLSIHKRELIRAALLHDFYLYDWHEKDVAHKWHGFHHAHKARDNAKAYFQINELEEGIILTHMWPLTLRDVPASQEALIVCLVDKWISTQETLHIDTRINAKIRKEYQA